jgi:hypothetical protein
VVGPGVRSLSALTIAICGFLLEGCAVAPDAPSPRTDAAINVDNSTDIRQSPRSSGSVHPVDRVTVDS